MLCGIMPIIRKAVREERAVPVSGMKISREEPVHFRVLGIGPSPLGQPLSQPGELRLEVEYLNHRTAPRLIPVQPAEFATYREAIQEAIDSRAVYSVDWNYPEIPASPPRFKDSAFDRLLNALRDKNIVPSG